MTTLTQDRPPQKDCCTTAHEKLTVRLGTLQASHRPRPQDFIVSLANSWPWQLQEEPPAHPTIRYSSSAYKAVGGSAPAQERESSPFTAVAHCHKPPRPYSLSSRPTFSATASRSRSAISSSKTSGSTRSESGSSHTLAHASSPVSPDLLQQFTRLWDNEGDCASGKDPPAPQLPQQQLPVLDPYDHMKTLLTQLASCISSITTAYAHQQAAIHSHNAQLAAMSGGAEAAAGHGVRANAIISATDNAMVEEMKSLSRLHSQLALLPRRLSFKKESAAVEGGAASGQDMKEVAVEKANTLRQLRRYEGIIARFHEEIWRKEAVVEALKETLAKSMLRGEKLHQRVQALEAELTGKAVQSTTSLQAC